MNIYRRNYGHAAESLLKLKTLGCFELFQNFFNL